MPLLDESADATNVNDDWISNFFDKTKIVSDSEMQSLWASILASEVNQPGSYAKRTISIIADLEKSDALLFKNLCSFIWDFSVKIPLIFNLQHSIYTANGVSFESIAHLESLGLITFGNRQEFSAVMEQPWNWLRYFDRRIFLNLGSPQLLGVGTVLLTKAGNELARVVNASPIDGFVEYVGQHYKELGFTIAPADDPVTMKIGGT